MVRANQDREQVHHFAPLLARTRTLHRPLGPIAYDCVKVIIVRDGSAFLFSEFGQKPVKPGDVILLGANVLAGSEPEGHITVTTIYLDTDYMLDQVRWQYAAFLNDRLDAQGFADKIYTEPAQILRVGEDRAGMLMPWLDELVALSTEGNFVRHYLRMQALWFQISHVIAPYVKVSPVRISPSQRGHIRPTLPRGRCFTPLRVEVRRAAALLRENPAKRWTLDELAAEVMLRLVWNTSTRMFMRVWMPTNILLDALRTRRGLRWGIPAMLLSAGYFAIAHWCTTLIADGGPGWLHLIVLLCIINAFKFLINGPITAARLISVRRRERKHDHPRQQAPSAPVGHEALPDNEHGAAYLGRTSGALRT